MNIRAWQATRPQCLAKRIITKGPEKGKKVQCKGKAKKESIYCPAHSPGGTAADWREVLS